MMMTDDSRCPQIGHVSMSCYHVASSTLIPVQLLKGEKKKNDDDDDDESRKEGRESVILITTCNKPMHVLPRFPPSEPIKSLTQTSIF